MIGYVCVGTNDLEKAAAFYEELLALIGAKRWMVEEQFVAWSVDPNQPAFAASKPYDEKAATIGNGTMVAFTAETTEMVDQFHAKALELGGADEGAPGPRGDDGFYAGYFRDLDGNKLNIFCYDKSK